MNEEHLDLLKLDEVFPHLHEAGRFDLTSHIPDNIEFIDEIGIAHPPEIKIGKLLAKHGYAIVVDDTYPNYYVELTPKGRDAKAAGGHFKYLKQQADKEQKDNEKHELEIQNLKLQIEQLQHESNRRKTQNEIDALTIKNLKKNNKVLAFSFAIVLIGWIVDFVSENAQWGWSVFQNQNIQKETPIDKNETETLYLDSLQSNQLNNSRTNDTIE